jgi:GT2 family glycosyltransferase
MDRAEPSLLIVSEQGLDTACWIKEANARAIPVICEGGPDLEVPDTVCAVSDEPTKAMRQVQEFLDSCAIGPSKPLKTKWEPLLTVVIPTYNRPTGLLRLLDRIGAQDLHPSLYEVVVVDDGSHMPARDVVGAQNYPFQLTIVQVDERQGSGKARNLGVERAQAPILVFFDDDTMPAVDNLRGHLMMQRAASRPHLITGGFELVDTRGDLSISQQAMQTVAFDLRDLRPAGPSEPEGFFACNASIPTEVVRKMKGFDSERFPRPVMDDIDFGYRLEAIDIAIRHCPELRCDRDHDISVDLFLEYCFNLGYYHHKLNEAHPDRSPVALVYRDQVGHKNFDLSLRSVAELEGAKAAGAISELRRFEQMIGPFDATQRTNMVKQLEMLARKVSVAPYCRGMVTARMDAGEVPIPKVEGSLSGHLTSVIIPNLNGFPHIIGCLESIRRTAEGPIEVIVVDNGSVDGSLEWLRTQTDIILVEMGENVGAPAARNRALEIAQGETILFSDNDVVFTPKWRSLMLNHMDAWPDIGIVGPMSDYVAGDQKTKELPSDNETLSVFAERFTSQHRGEHQYAMRLILFCMMVRRSVIDKIGGFDQDFGQWGFEDDDFTLRAKLAGFQMRIAKDCFIRHIGSQTAYSAKLNYQNLLVKNWGVFKSKWGIEAVPYGATVSLLDVMKDKTFHPDIHIEPIHTGTMSAHVNTGILLYPIPASRQRGVPGKDGVDPQTTDEIISKFSPALGNR